MRRLAILSLLVLTGCASAPQSSPYAASAIPLHTPPELQRPWLVQRPADEVTLFDTRTLSALRKVPDSASQNDSANGTENGAGKSAVKVGLWVGVALGAAAVIHTAVDTSENILECLFGGCDDDD